MRKTLFTLLLSLAATLGWAQNFTLSSTQLQGQATAALVFNAFGCTGENQSPALQWANPPEGTQSYAITMYDPDAPTGSGWWHWLAFDIPTGTLSLPAGAGAASGELMPKGSIQSRTDYSSPGYGGPCPPEGHGLHQYIITVYALKTPTLGLDAQANPALVGYYLGQQTLAKASLVFYHQR